MRREQALRPAELERREKAPLSPSPMLLLRRSLGGDKWPPISRLLVSVDSVPDSTRPPEVRTLRKYANSATSTVEHNRSRKLHVCGYLSSAVRHEPLVSRCLDTLSAGGGGDAGDVAASGVVSAVRLLVMCGS